jgi:hypothetical protein
MLDRDENPYIHIPKTGGTSITLSLVIFNSHDPAVKRRKEDNHWNNDGWIFTIVRDPWDHAVSWFLHSRGFRKQPTFESWVRAGCGAEKKISGLVATDQLGYITDEDGSLMVNTAYRFEWSIPTIYDMICQKLEIGEPPELRHDVKRQELNCAPKDDGAKWLERLPGYPKRPHFSLFYTDDAVELVREQQRAFLRKFPYEFDDRR